MKKDLHYLITRIINPHLNLVITMLRSGGRVVYGRDGYTGLRWVDHTLGDMLASELEKWRDEMWYRYSDSDLVEKGEEIIDSLLEILIQLDAKLPDDVSKYKLLDELWEMAGKVEKYLGLGGYIASRRDYFNAKVESMRKRDEELRRRAQREKKREISKIRLSKEHKPRTISRKSSRKLAKRYVNRRKRRVSWKSILGFVFVLLVFFALWDLGYNDGQIVGRFLPTFRGKVSNVPSPTESPFTETLSTETFSHTTTSHTSMVPKGTLGFVGSSCSNAPHSLELALECYLNNPEEIRTLGKLASHLKGQNLQKSAWNILEWEDGHIKYDWKKYHGVGPMTIQRPSETIQQGSGVCVDYAVLTAGLLLAMNYSPLYVFEIEFSNDPSGHAAAAIKINGEYFMLDQHPPILDLGSYYVDLKYYRKEAFNGTQPNLIISSAKVYEIRRKSDKVIVNLVETLTANDFKKQNYAFSQADLTKIVEDLKIRFLREFPNLKLDQGIANLDTSRYLPRGYSSGKSWEQEFPHFVEYYNPVFHNEFVDYFYSHITDDSQVVSDLRTYTRFWIKGKIENGAIKIILCLAKP